MKKFNSKVERREFLNRSRRLLGATGVGVLLTSLGAHDPVFAKLSGIHIGKHTDDFIGGIHGLSDGKELKNNDTAFLQSLNNFDELLASGDGGATRLYDDISDQLKNVINSGRFGVDDLGLAGLTKQLSNSMVGGYVSASNDLDHGAISISEMKRTLDRNTTLEAGFIETYTSKMNSEIEQSYEFSIIIEEGDKRLSELIRHYKSSLSSAESKSPLIAMILGIDDAAAQDQGHNEEAIIIAIVIVAVAAVIKFISKRNR